MCKDRNITASLGNRGIVFPSIQSEFLLSQLLPVVTFPPATHPCEESGSFFSVNSSRRPGGLQDPHHPPELPLAPRLKKPQFSILSSQDKCRLTGDPWSYWWPSDELTPVWNTERSLGRKYTHQIILLSEKKTKPKQQPQNSKRFCFVFSLKYAYFPSQ